jgi:hypothetical protein
MKRGAHPYGIVRSRSHPQVQQVRDLQTRTGRDRTGLFYAEGIRAVEQRAAIKTIGSRPVERGARLSARRHPRRRRRRLPRRDLCAPCRAAAGPGASGPLPRPAGGLRPRRAHPQGGRRRMPQPGGGHRRPPLRGVQPAPRRHGERAASSLTAGWAAGSAPGRGRGAGEWRRRGRPRRRLPAGGPEPSPRAGWASGASAPGACR